MTFRNCTKRTGVTGCYVGANAVGNLQGIRSPEFPRPNKIVAGTRCIIGANIIGLAFKIDAERQPPCATEFSRK